MKNTERPFSLTDGDLISCVATTLPGLEPVLSGELERLGAGAIHTGVQAVRFSGDSDMLYRANYLLRTAHRVLVPLFRVEKADYERLYQACLEHAWERYLDVDGTFLIETVGGSNFMRNRNFATLRVKDGLADRFNKRFGRRPSVGREGADVVIGVYLENDSATLSIDTSGRSLHRRGYRLEKIEAPLMETMAAGILLASGWIGQHPLVDPMCGSGTIAIEAALLAANIPPGSLRRDFGLMRLPGFDRKKWLAMTAQAQAARKALPAGLILAADIDPVALEISRKNAVRAGVDGLVQFSQADFFLTENIPAGTWLVSNPPYGERMNAGDIRDFYGSLGDSLKKNWKGCRACILSGSFAGAKAIGLRPSRRTALWNGGIECRLLEFDLY